MIVILDTTKGEAHNFTTRADAAKFIGISRPTLRIYLANPFYLYKTLIITYTSNEKVQRSKRALLKKQMAQFREEEIQRVLPENRNVPVNDSRSEQPAEVGGGE